MSLLPDSLRRFVSKAFDLAGKEASALKELHEDSKATVRRMTEEDPGLKELLDNAHAYAVFPAVGKATAVIGGAFGRGEVFRGDQLVGYAGLVQLTLGLQLGGQTFSEIVLFQDEKAFARFKSGRTTFAATASAVLVKAGAAAANNYDAGAMVFVSSEGGMMLEAALGAQRFLFKPAALGRTKSAPRKSAGKSAPKSSAPRKSAPRKSSSAPRKSSSAPRKSSSAPRKSAKAARSDSGKKKTARQPSRAKSARRPTRTAKPARTAARKAKSSGPRAQRRPSRARSSR